MALCFQDVHMSVCLSISTILNSRMNWFEVGGQSSRSLWSHIHKSLPAILKMSYKNSHWMWIEFVASLRQPLFLKHRRPICNLTGFANLGLQRLSMHHFTKLSIKSLNIWLCPGKYVKCKHWHKKTLCSNLFCLIQWFGRSHDLPTYFIHGVVLQLCFSFSSPTLILPPIQMSQNACLLHGAASWVAFVFFI